MERNELGVHDFREALLGSPVPYFVLPHRGAQPLLPQTRAVGVQCGRERDVCLFKRRIRMHSVIEEITHTNKDHNRKTKPTRPQSCRSSSPRRPGLSFFTWFPGDRNVHCQSAGRCPQCFFPMIARLEVMGFVAADPNNCHSSAPCKAAKILRHFRTVKDRPPCAALERSPNGKKNRRKEE